MDEEAPSSKTVLWPPPNPNAAKPSAPEPGQMDIVANTNDVERHAELDAQRRSEIQALMKDKSLSKEERKGRMDEVKKRYAEMKSQSLPVGVGSGVGGVAEGGSVDAVVPTGSHVKGERQSK